MFKSNKKRNENYHIIKLCLIFEHNTRTHKLNTYLMNALLYCKSSKDCISVRPTSNDISRTCKSLSFRLELANIGIKSLFVLFARYFAKITETPISCPISNYNRNKSHRVSCQLFLLTLTFINAFSGPKLNKVF